VEHRIQVQVAPPTENDPGAIVEGSYTLTEDGVVRVYDHNLLGTEHLAGAVAAATARRVLREKKSPNAFCGRSRQLFIVLGNPKHHALCIGVGQFVSDGARLFGTVAPMFWIVDGNFCHGRTLRARFLLLVCTVGDQK
jgi:hypothetical protein